MKILKIFSLVFALCLCLAAFSGCKLQEYATQVNSKVQQDKAARETQKSFELIQDDGYTEIWRDKKTDVLYFAYRVKSGYGVGIGMNVLYNSDGSPLLYAEWVEMEAYVHAESIT